MTSDLAKTNAKKELEPRRLTDKEAGQEVDLLKENYKKHQYDKAQLYRSFYRIDHYQVHTNFKSKGYKSAEDLIRDILPDVKFSMRTFREGRDLYRKFLNRVLALPEYQKSPTGAEDFAEKRINEYMAAVEYNTEYVKELSRTAVIGANKQDSSTSAGAVKRIFKECDGIDDFIKKSRKQFGGLDEKKIAAAKKRVDRVPPPEGSKVSINARVDSPFMPVIIKMIETQAREAGLTMKYADMTTDQIGQLIYLDASKQYGKIDEASIDERRKHCIGLMGRVMELLFGSRPDDEHIDKFMEEISQKMKDTVDLV